ncbi:MAG TPA: MotA/TolQ/ExbB proton channel family protein, partial [Longimicrobium sp.]|nr:MotA/TolQ/ExbB proton channel family protein [Longimicrobium sp.]
MITSDFALFVWQGNSAFGKLVTLTLMGLGGAAGGAALWHSHRYRVTEMAALDGVRSKLRRLLAADLPGAEGEDGALAPPPTTVELPMLREHVPPGTLIGDRLAALARMKQARVKVHVDALQQVTALSESRRATLAFPAYAVDLAMMLGMLGTFFGLCLMLMQMQGVLPAAGGAADAGGFTRAAASLGSIIASKKTAFVTTLFGLTVAIGVSALNFLLARAQAACYEALERFTVEELLPATAATVEDETAMERL